MILSKRCNSKLSKVQEQRTVFRFSLTEWNEKSYITFAYAFIADKRYVPPVPV
jgi:hypothetical protein